MAPGSLSSMTYSDFAWPGLCHELANCIS
jgi:hypothetical protein